MTNITKNGTKSYTASLPPQPEEAFIEACAYIYRMYLQSEYTVCTPEDNLDIPEQGREETLGNDDVPSLNTRKCFAGNDDVKAENARRKSSSETQGFKGDGKGRERLGARKKGEGRGRERGKGKPWEASLYRSFLHRRANTISEV